MKKINKDNIYQYVPIILLVVLCIVFSIATGGRFSSAVNIKTMVSQTLVIAVLSLGAIFNFSTGNINASMGGASAVAAIVGARVYNSTGSWVLLVIVTLGVGLFIMLGTCIFSLKFHVHMMMMTLIVMNLLSAIQSAMLVGKSSEGVPYSFVTVSNQYYLPFIIAGVFLIICVILFNLTPLGRQLKFLGANASCADQTGFDYNKLMIISFGVAGFAAGLAGILTLMRTASIGTTTNASANMDVMLAIVLAGMPINGGAKSKISAGIIGSFLVTVLNSGLVMVGVSSTIIQAIRGICFIVIIALAVEKGSGIPGREI